MKKFLKQIATLSFFVVFLTNCSEIGEEKQIGEESIVTRSGGEANYYLLDGKYIPVLKNNEKFYVMFYTADESKIRTELSKQGITLKREEEVKEYYSYSCDMIGSSAKKFSNYKTAIIESSYEKAANVLSNTLYWAPFYKFATPFELGVEEMGITNQFFVKLRSEADLELLQRLANDNSVELISAFKDLEGWYTLACTNISKGNALEMANIFYGSGLFDNACPDVFGIGRVDCINELYFTSSSAFLWHLGNSSININYCNAKTIISQGSPNVKIAIIDSGVDQNHRDFCNVLPGWDAETGTTPNNFSYLTGNTHGTMVAGLIGAVPNNNNGAPGYGDAAGIASGATILPISFRIDASGNILSSASVMVSAINYAVNAGACIINCSWRYDSPAVGAAVINALDNGCTVVFGSGNNSASSVHYLAGLDSRIIVVGAINKYGIRPSFSNYGSGLDLVAPGDLILSLAPNNDISIASGTSFAASQVSAVAALILSISPNFWPQHVRNIIKSTCTKINPNPPLYTYSTNTPNGSWDPEVGHGLLNAYDAVSSAYNAWSLPRTLNVTISYLAGPSNVIVDGLSPGTSNSFKLTNYIGSTVDDYLSVPSNYRIDLEEDPRGADFIMSGDGTSNLQVTRYLLESGSVVNLTLKFSVRTK